MQPYVMSPAEETGPRPTRVDAQRLRIVTSDSEFNQRIRAAIHEIDAAVLTGRDAVDAAIARLIIGDAVAARRYLQSMQPDHPHYLRLYLALAYWSGDLGFLRSRWADAMGAAAQSSAELRRSLAAVGDSIGESAASRTLTGGILSTSDPASANPQNGGVRLLLDTINDLGVAPDALKGRIALRARLRPEWVNLRLERLRFGDTELNVELTRRNSHHVFSCEPVAGAAPVRLVLELVVDVPAIERITIDGKPANLDYRQAESGLFVCPVQLVLDHTRVMEVDAIV